MNRQVIRTVYRVKDGVAGVIHTDPVMVPVTVPAREALSYEEFIVLARKPVKERGEKHIRRGKAK